MWKASISYLYILLCRLLSKTLTDYRPHLLRLKDVVSANVVLVVIRNNVVIDVV